MDNRELIQNSIDYIEENLMAEITAKELADQAGFSLFHYYRLFQSAVGMPVMQYIVRRKLLNAIYEISCGKKMVDVALNYGFETHAGFYKAFKRELGDTPALFLKKYRAKQPYRINLLKEEHMRITHKKLSEILKKWNQENERITDVFYTNGNQNEGAFYVGDSYVLKVSANLTKLKNHIDISKALEHVGISAATPIRSAEGNEIVEDGELYFILTHRLNGNRIKADDMYTDPCKARFVGEIIGQLSMALKKVDAVVDDVNLLDCVENWAIPRATEMISMPHGLCKDYTETFGDLYGKLPRQIIHRDPNPGNIIIADDGWGFIDFELSERNVRIFDPCYAATGILSESFVKGDKEKLLKWITVYRNVILGYDSVAKLTREERKAIPYVVLSIQLIFTAWCEGQEEIKDIFETNMEMTRWVIENFEKLKIDD